MQNFSTLQVHLLSLLSNKIELVIPITRMNFDVENPLPKWILNLIAGIFQLFIIPKWIQIEWRKRFKGLGVVQSKGYQVELVLNIYRNASAKNRVNILKYYSVHYDDFKGLRK